MKIALGCVAAGLVAVLSGCAAPADPKTDSAVRVVTSTNVYGELASRVGGADIDVTSIIGDSARDPHEFEGDGQSELAIAKADIIISNGGGYDPFIDGMVDASGNDSVVVIEAVGLAPAREDSPGFNEHVWYDFSTMIAIARSLAERLATVDPDNASEYVANAELVVADLELLRERAVTMAGRYAGSGIVVTEPVPLYLLELVGLIDRTPPGFSAAIEDGRDAPVAVLRSTVELLEGGDVAFLAYNEQTAGSQSDALIAAAEVGGVPVIPVSETLPPDTSYVDWMGAMLDQIDTAFALNG